MLFALLGDHPDGLEMTRALVATGRHQLALYHGPAVGAEFLRRWGVKAETVGDMEEALADPRIEAVIVGGRLDERPGQLRRALQSERHVLCVHPADMAPDIAYEAAMIQGDTRRVLLPLLPESLHPGVRRLAEIGRNEALLGDRRLIETERAAPDPVLIDEGRAEGKVSVPGWDVLRVVGGEIAEVSGFAPAEHLCADQPALLAGAFEGGQLFRAAYLPGQHESSLRLAAAGSYARAELVFAGGWPGPATLKWQDETGTTHAETYEAWNPWLPVIEAFELAVAERSAAPSSGNLSETFSWQSEIRALELDDAARRSVERRRVSVLEYPEATEATGFKGTMTLVGCGLIWVILILLILSRWFPTLGWVILPVLLFFLGLQVLRWLVPAAEEQDESTPST
ncbi:MAG TPA: hypothetical protein VGY58_18770 [Gemmataceae bacterium]|jgi:predicted dehydrogenase|nr:hypothetical protein [Gemmataceae bacterium]